MKRFLVSFLALVLIFSSFGSSICLAAAGKVSKDVYKSYDFSKRVERSETGHRYRYEEVFFFDFTNNILVRCWDQQSRDSRKTGYGVYIMKPKNGLLYAYDEDDQLCYCFQNCDKEKLREKLVEQMGKKAKKLDGVFIDVYEYNTSGKLVDKLSSWDIKKQPPEKLKYCGFYEKYLSSSDLLKRFN